jgi:hypothetical protein
LELTNSKRIVTTASYVTPRFTPDEQRLIENSPGGALKKLNLLRALALDDQDLARMRDRMGQGTRVLGAAEFSRIAEVSRRLRAGVSNADIAGEAMPLLVDSLVAYAKLAVTAKDDPTLRLIGGVFEYQRSLSPVGRLHLERLEMYPAGVERGEMVFTVAMAPGETVTISHKEWSTSTSGFEDIVEDFFESYSERGVAEKTDASMSTENESKFADTLNFGASASGGLAGVSISTTLGLTKSDEFRTSLKQSMKSSREITEKASARTRKDHKVSIKLETKKGVDDSSFRTITNPSANAVRLDYFRLMRKWRTDLFRYGIRLTYDIAIPTPGVRLWAQYERIAEIEQTLRTPLQFGLKPSDLNEGNYRDEALKVRAVVDDMPPLVINTSYYGDIPVRSHDDAEANTFFGRVEFDVPQGYTIFTPFLTASISWWADAPQVFKVLNAEAGQPDTIPRTPTNPVTVTSSLPNHVGLTGHIVVEYVYYGVNSGFIQVDVEYERTAAWYEAWQRTVWGQIRAAAEARDQEEKARLQEERDRLWRLLYDKDTLTLRRLEREELVRLVLQWLLGPTDPALADATVDQVIQQLLANEESFRLATRPPLLPTLDNIGPIGWYRSLLFGEFVKFVHQAVEWENLLYFLYPYFWGSELVGRDKMLFQHPDAEHDRFLRAGYARVVLTIRPGFEEDFTRLVETGSLGEPYTSPYMPIAQEIENFARTNYAGVPPANPEKEARPLLYPEQRKTWDTMQATMTAIDTYKATNGDYPASLAALPGGEPLDAWGRAFVYRLPGLGADYDLISLGADEKPGGEDLDADISSAAPASLVASWFDYTPTSGIDIDVNTIPAQFA